MLAQPAIRSTRLLATALLVLSLTGVLTAAAAGAASGLTWSELLDLFVVTNAVIGLSLAIAGWPIAMHRPDNLVGWSLLAGGCFYAATAAGITLLAVSVQQGWHGAAWRLGATVTNVGWAWALALFIPLALLTFPDGRLPGRGWRSLAVLLVVNGLLFVAAVVSSPSGLSDEVGVTGYLAGSGYPVISPLVNSVTAVGVVVSYAGALVGLIVRYKRGTEQVRRQLLWLVLALLVVSALFTLDALLQLESLLTIVPIALLPISISMAVLRHQLLDIRLVLSRSVLYTLLTASVVGIYLGAVSVMDQTVRRQVPLGSSVLAALLIAVAFNPVRMWLQRYVDRAFYGSRQDPVRAVAEVGARLGDVGVTDGGGLTGVLQSLCDVLRFPSAAITVGGVNVATYGESSGVRQLTPLAVGEGLTGELVVVLRTGEKRLNPSDERVLTLLAAPVAVAVRANAWADEVHCSREKVISGREEERRRLLRDLHDGLGPVLTGVVLSAEAARTLITTDPVRSAALMERLRDQTTGAIDDIRRLVDDLRPPALDGLGLLGALREQVSVLSHKVDGTPLQVTLIATSTLAELPAAVEVAAYRIATEALTNIVRHSNANRATLALTLDHCALRVSIHDDGSTLAKGWQAGVGLTSIQERATELGGRCDIREGAKGFSIEVTLPLTVADPVAAQPLGSDSAMAVSA